MTRKLFVSSGRMIFCLAMLTTALTSIPCYADDSQKQISYLDTAGSLGSLNGASAVTNPGAGAANSISSIGHVAPPIEGVPRERGVNWSGVLLQSATFLMVEQGFRLGTQPTTREALKGEFFDDWFQSVKATKGWGDGDDFLTNYIGHPMEGAVVGNIFVQNDPVGRKQVFGWNTGYWNSRLKATAWSAVYSTQFELGPFSEASIGNVGHSGKSMSGAVDLVITPIAGLGWQVGEDALDKYIVVKIESWTSSPVLKMLARGVLNPTRSFANVMRLTVPWHRDMRPGIWGRRRTG